MALMPGQLYDALRAGNVPDDKAPRRRREGCDYEGELTRLRLEIAERFKATDERISRLEADVRPLKWMMGFVLAFQVANFFLQFRRVRLS